MKGATEELFVKLHATKRERALGALNGTLLCISLSASSLSISRLPNMLATSIIACFEGGFIAFML